LALSSETQSWTEYIFADAIDVNPKRILKKGTVAKSMAMADVKEFVKKISDYEEKEFKGGTKFQNNDTIMARITPCLENGKIAFVDILKDNEIAFGSTEFIVLSGKETIITPEFVYYTAISPNIRSRSIKAMTGTS
jgi:type I restriction enzyme S subunit